MTGRKSRVAAVRVEDVLEYEILGFDYETQCYIVSVKDPEIKQYIAREIQEPKEFVESNGTISAVETIKNIERKY